MSFPRILNACLGFWAAASLLPQPGVAQSKVAESGNDLKIVWTDVEGGAATLIVTPTGQSLLVDTGFPQDDRDAKRIFAAAQAAGLKKIDILWITHFHLDHVGGVAALAKLIPIDKFYDHGDSIEVNTPQGAKLYDDYKAAAQGKRVLVRPGDRIPLRGVDITAVSAAGQVISKPVSGGSVQNDFCKDAQQKPEDKTENGQSAGFLLTYGRFKFLDLGDLTWDREMMLACPVNKLGEVTLFQASHHGFSGGQSGAPAMVWALRPRVVVVNDGARKGFEGDAYEIIAKIPGVEGIWQIHRSVLRSDAAHNTTADMTANLEEGAADQGLGLKAIVSADGKFTVTNMRNNFSKSYTSR